MKGETKPKVNLSEDQLKAIARINEATKYVKSKGFTVEKFNGADGEKSKELANTYYRQLKAIQKRKNEEFLEYRRSRPKRQDYDSFKAWQKAVSEHNEKIKLQSRENQGISVFKQILEKINYNSEELSSKEASKYADIYVLRDSKGVIAAIGSATTATVSTGGPTMLIEWIGSAQVVKGAGSALWGAMVKSHSLQNGYSISFDVADNAVPFWSTMGLEIQTVNGTASLKNVKDFAEELE